MSQERSHRLALALDYSLLAVAWAAVRLPFLRAVDLVSYDGTYYITQAREILAGNPGAGGAFPPGYPLAIALVHALVGDGVRAAQSVSLAASLVSVLALYLLARGVLPRAAAFGCALVFATTPLTARLSMTTMSESLYVAWLLLGLLAYARTHNIRAGIALGAAAVTRPEALAVAFGLLVYDAVRFRNRRRSADIGLSFIAVYSIAVLLPLAGGYGVTLIPKFAQLGQGAAGWRALEAGADPPGAGAVLVHYLSRIPGDVTMLFRHTAGVALVAAVAGIARHPGFILVALIPFVVNPAFTLRPEPRFVLPFVPVVILYAFVAAASIRSSRRRLALFAILFAAAVVGFRVNVGLLTEPESQGYAPARHAGEQLRDHIAPRSIVADRKPFLAFYANARYREIPPGRYDATLDTLRSNGSDYLALMTDVTDFFRPDLEPLLYNEAAVIGEARLRQVYADAAGVAVFAILDGPSPPQPHVLLDAEQYERVESPRWTADGSRLVFSSNRRGSGAVCSVDAATAAVDTLALRPGRVGPAAPSPDGRRIAFVTTESGTPDIHMIDVETGETTELVRSSSRDVDPSWDGNGAVLFASEIGRHFNVYRIGVDGVAAAQRIVTGTRARRPRLSPGGAALAWTEVGGIRVGSHNGTGARPAARLTAVSSVPSWSPDGNHLVVSARTSGSDDVYIIDVRSLRAVRLTTDAQRDESDPDWHPVENRIAYVSDQSQVVVIGDVGVFLERLHGEYRPRTYGKAAGRTPDGS